MVFLVKLSWPTINAIIEKEDFKENNSKQHKINL